MKLLGVRLGTEKRSKFLNLYHLDYLNRKGEKKVYSVVSRNNLEESFDSKSNAVCMVAYHGEFNKWLVLHEFRMSVNKKVYNLCGGLIEEGEAIHDCLKRELKEETGLDLVMVNKVSNPNYSAVGISDEMVTTAFCTVVGKLDSSKCSANEDITPMLLSTEELKDLAKNNNLTARLDMFIAMLN